MELSELKHIWEIEKPNEQWILSIKKPTQEDINWALKEIEKIKIK